jgi:hypothetical protein
MTIDQALDALLKIACTVFPGDSDRKFPVEVNMMNLRKAIEDLFQAQEIPVGTKMNDKTRQSPKCKVYASSQILLSPVSNLWLGSSMLRRPPMSAILTYSAIIPTVDRVSIPPSSMLSVRRWAGDHYLHL